MGSLDLMDCQVGNRKFPNCQVGKGKEMRLSESLMNSEESSDQQGVLTGENQKIILIIGGIRVFLPRNPVEARVCVADATTTGGQPKKLVMEEEVEQTLTFSQGDEGDEHSEEWLKIFSQEAEKEMTATLELAAEEDEHSLEWLEIFGQRVEQKVTVVLETIEAEEEEADNIDFVVLCEEIEALERRVKVQGMHIQQIRLETEGEYQPKE
jgi:hypothetical protein